jgi:hypothetical protein
MSDQTPPTSGPTPDPDSEPTSEPTPEAGETAAQEPEATTVETDPAAAPPPKKSGKGKIFAIIAAVVVVVLVAGGLIGYFVLKSDAHKLTTPASAGSMKRDTAKEKTLSTQLTQAEQQFITQGKGKCAKKTTYVKSAIYNQSSTKRGPEGGLVFLGAKLKTPQDPATWRKNCFAKPAKDNGLTVTNVDSGDGDSKAACAAVTSPQKVAICAWATNDTIGELVPTVPGYDANTLAKIMRSVRSDVEQGE